MSKLTRSIVVNIRFDEAFSQWTKFESFPMFMDGVRKVERIDETHYRWHASLWGKEEEWEAEITKQIPGRRIEWRYTCGARNAGAVTFNPLSPDKTVVTLQLGYDPESITERIGDALGIVERRIEADLQNFKNYVER